jgi:hypothetical protein
MIFEYGSCKAPLASTHLADMEAFFVVKGEVGLKAPRLCKDVSQHELCESYEEVLWERSSNGLEIKREIDDCIMRGLEPDT